MLAPLSWLSEYTVLPENTRELTDRLTSIGHMLDKQKKIGNENVLDLELRGNRSDMFSIYGIARDISAAFKKPLKPLDLAELPPIDHTSPLVDVDKSAAHLIHRYTALTLTVKVNESPVWLKEKLSFFDIPSINNVVDITNFVLLELGQTLHAFDANKIAGKKLILRKAKNNELFHTIKQGLDVKLTSQDLVIADTKKPQALSMIGGFDSKVSNETAEIILESAVYDQADCRQCARRHKIFTSSGNIHEKLLSPVQVEIALQRAIYLLQLHASAKITSKLSDYYPNPVKPLTINFDFNKTSQLSGLEIKNNDQIFYLQSLGFLVTGNSITVPPYRTDIQSVADLVEEVLRLHGYDHIPQNPLYGLNKPLKSFPESNFISILKNYLVSMGLDEVITLPLISDTSFTDKNTLIYPQNPPDPEKNILRPSLLPGLVEYTRRQLNLNNPRITIFEIGHVFSRLQNKYHESVHLGISISGNNLPKNWHKKADTLTIYDLKGYIDKISTSFQIPVPSSVQEFSPNIFTWEMDLEDLIAKNSKPIPNYHLISNFPPVIEDFNIILKSSYTDIITRIKSLSSLITQIDLIDKYEDKLTLRIIFHDPSRQLSREDITPIRLKIESL